MATRDYLTTGDSEDNYTFDPDKITIGDEGATLKAQSGFVEEPLQFEETFTSDADFTYNSSLAEFTGGLVRQSDQTPSNSVLGALYTSSIDASWRTDGGSLTGTANGTPTISGGKLVCTGGSPILKGVYYSITNDGQAAIKFKYTPDYSGAPGGNINMVGIQEAAVNNNRMILTHSPSGDNFRITATNSTGTTFLLATTIGGSGVGLVSGTEYEIELNWDYVAGTIRLFLDGALHGTLSPGTWTFVANAARLYVGAMPSTYNVADASFDDVVFFSTVQHTSSYTAGYSLPANRYLASTVILPEFSDPTPGGIVSFDDFTTVETGAPRYTIKLDDGNFLYWTGVVWGDADGTYAQANTASEFDTNLPSLIGTATPQDVTIRSHFDDTNVQGSISNLLVDYTGQTEYYTDNPTLTPNDAIENLSDSSQVTDITAVAVTPTGSNLKYVLTINGTAKYWDGDSWEDSSGVAESNIYNELTETELVQLDIENNDALNIIWYFVSDGSVTACLSEWSITTSGTVDLKTIAGIFVNSDGSPVTDGEVRISPVGLTSNTVDNVQIGTTASTTATNSSSGAWSTTLVSNVRYIFAFYEGDTLIGKFIRNVSGTGEIEFDDLEEP